MTSANPSRPNLPDEMDEDPLELARRLARKRPREQLNCSECYRRKQKCDRKFPCNHCRARRIPERCIAPTPLENPGHTVDPSSSSSRRNYAERGLPYPPTRTPSSGDLAGGWNLDTSDPAALLAHLESLEQSPDVRLHHELRNRLDSLDRRMAAQTSGFGQQGPGPASSKHRMSVHEASTPTGSISAQGAGRSTAPFISTPYVRTRSERVYEDPSGSARNQRDAGEYLAENGYNGATAIVALTRAPLLNDKRTTTDPESISDDHTFFRHSSTSSSLDKLLGLDHFRNNEIRSIFKVLPSIPDCEGLIGSYFLNWDWTRYPLPPHVFPQDWQSLINEENCVGLLAAWPHNASKNRIASLALLFAVLACGSITPSLLSSDDHARSAELFWAANQIIGYCQTHASDDSQVLWARTVVVRFADMARNTQATWQVAGGMIRNAIDQGLHRDGASFGLSDAAIAERRVLWSHILHDDREWALVLGRPLMIGRYSTLMPSEKDLEEFPWDVRQYLMARNDLTPLMTRVSELFQDFQDLDAPAPTEGSSSDTFARQKDAAFDTLFAIDDELETYLDKLPAIFSVNPVHINYATEARYPRLKVYRQVIIGSVYFIRILLHRPFMLNSRRFGEVEGPYRTCWRRCVDTAIRDLRLRNMWRLTLSETEQTMMYGGAWAEFNSVTVLGISLLLSSELKEEIDPELQRESLEYILGCCKRLQGDLDAGKDDAVSARERKVMDALLLRLGSCLRNPDGSRLELLDTNFAQVAVEVKRVNTDALPAWTENAWFEGADGQPSLLDPFLMEFFVDDWNLMFNT